MGYWAGAQFEDASWALSLHLLAYSIFCFFFLHVNRDGKRFMNEDTWVQAKAIRCLQQPRGDYAFSVFDKKWFDEVGERAEIAGSQSQTRLYAFTVTSGPLTTALTKLYSAMSSGVPVTKRTQLRTLPARWTCLLKISWPL